MLTFPAHLKRILRYSFYFITFHKVAWNAAHFLRRKAGVLRIIWHVLYIVSAVRGKSLMLYGAFSLFMLKIHSIIIEVIKCNSYCRKLSVEVNVNTNNSKASNNTSCFFYYCLPVHLLMAQRIFPTSFNASKTNMPCNKISFGYFSPFAKAFV